MGRFSVARRSKRVNAAMAASLASLFLVLLPCSGSSAPSLPSAEELRDHTAQAAGSEPQSQQYSIAFTIGATSGVRHTARRGGDFRTAVDEGPLHSESGSLGGVAWRQNENGETIVARREPGLAQREALTTSVERSPPPLTGYVLATLDATGYGTKLYVDGATWRIVRREVVARSGTTVTVYDDFRRVGGFERAWHWLTDDGHPENRGEYRLLSASDAAVGDAELAIPADRRKVVQFPPATQSAALPVSFSGGQIFVRVNIGSRAVDFLLDTGASEIAIDENVAQQLGLPLYGVHSYAGSARRFSGGRVIVPEMRIGPLTMHDVVAITVPSVNVSSGKRRAVGLLGFDFIDALGLKIDYARGAVDAVPSEAFVPPAAATVLEARLEGGSPQVDVRVNGALGERFVIDTGNSGSFLIFDFFARRYPGALVDLGGGGGRDRRFRGIGGSVQTAPYQLETIDLAGFQFHDFVGYRVLATSEFAINDDGLIGSDLLRYFDLYVDYAHSRLYLAPNDLGRGLLSLPPARAS